MNVYLEEIRKRLIGLEYCHIKVGYGGKLRLGLGDKIYYKQPRLQGKFYGAWDILSVFCSWRISDGKTLICGYDDEIKFSNEVLESVQLGRIRDITQPTNFDIRIVFNSGVIIDYFLQSKDNEGLVILGEKENIAYELYWNGWVKTNSEESSSKLTKIEEILSTLSQNCHNRWNSLIVHVDDKNCRDCFYFRGLDGHFYFWDYGICSNGESMFDSKLVNVQSGCNCFKELKDLII